MCIEVLFLLFELMISVLGICLWTLKRITLEFNFITLILVDSFIHLFFLQIYFLS